MSISGLFREFKTELRALLIILLICLATIVVIWQLYGKKLEDVDSRIKHVETTN